MRRFLIFTLLLALLALSTPTAALAAGMDKDTVRQVQQALNDAGYDCGTPDGVSGRKTAAAITQYQADRGLATTGEIDEALLSALGLLPEADGKAEEAEAEPSEVEAAAASPLEMDETTGYPVVTFGHWQVDTDFSNGEDGKDAVEWLVLESDDQQALLLSRYILMDMSFNNVYGDAKGRDWAKSALRDYLNGDFLSGAFAKDEQKAIRRTALKNPAGSQTGAKGGDSKDQVFLLSYDELMQYLPEQAARAALRTAFADAALQGSAEGVASADSWWLRTPGVNNAMALLVEDDGAVDLSVGEPIVQPRGVRPAVRVDVTNVPGLQ